MEVTVPLRSLSPEAVTWVLFGVLIVLDTIRGRLRMAREGPDRVRLPLSVRLRRVAVLLAVVAVVWLGLQFLALQSRYHDEATRHASIATASLLAQQNASFMARLYRETAANDERFLDMLKKRPGLATKKERTDALDADATKSRKMADDQATESELCGKRASYHARMKEKYERAAARPWRHVAADLPPP
jgi:hypothetical protein